VDDGVKRDTGLAGEGRDEGEGLFIFGAAQGENERIFLSFGDDVVKNDLPNGGELILRPTGVFTYISPNPNFSNADQVQFRYTASDEAGQQSTATATIAPGRKGEDNVLVADKTGGLLKGFGGDDKLNGRNRKDKLDGGAGDDRLDGAGGNDELICGAGNDNAKGGNGNDLLRGGAGNDRLDGEAGNDRLFGNGGDDIIFSGSGNDVLRGGSGADVLIAEEGKADMKGGKGKDDFVVEAAGGNVVIQDFRLGQDELIIGELSGGQKQRVVVTYVVAKQDAVLLLDEPNVNVELRIRLEDVARTPRQEKRIEAYLQEQVEAAGLDWPG